MIEVMAGSDGLGSTLPGKVAGDVGWFNVGRYKARET